MAAYLASEFRMRELAGELHRLIEDVESGKAFDPILKTYYARRLADYLSRIYC